MTLFHKISLKTRLTFSFLILSTLMVVSLGIAILKIQQVETATTQTNEAAGNVQESFTTS